MQKLTKQLQDPAFDSNARDEQGDTSLHLLVKRSFDEKALRLKAELIVCMLTYSAVDIDISDNTGNTPLHTAVKVFLNLWLSYTLLITVHSVESRSPYYIEAWP